MFFGNGGANLHNLYTMETCGHSINSFIMFFDPRNMGLDTLFVQLCEILADIYIHKGNVFGNGGANLHNSYTMETCGHSVNSFIMFFDPHNMGLDTLIVHLSAILVEI